MGDSHRANRRLTGYGPTTSTLCRPWFSRMIVASPLPFLARVMTVFVVASFVFGLAGASFAPIGPCVVSPEGRLLSCALAFRNATSGASFEKPPPAVGLCGSTHPVQAHRGSPPCSSSGSPLLHHREEGGNTSATVRYVSGLGQSDPANPTQFVVGLNDTAVDSCGLHVLRDMGSTMSCMLNSCTLL